jgi:hypothetical protein
MCTRLRLKTRTCSFFVAVSASVLVLVTASWFPVTSYKVEPQLAAQHADIVIGGDLLLAQEQHQGRPHSDSSCETATRLRNPEAAFGGGLLQELQQADAVFANLETLISGADFVPSSFTGAEQSGFRARPEVVNLLKAGAVTAVCLSNNHMLDGEDGVRDTIRVLDAQGILHAGAGNNIDRAMEPATHNVRGINIGVLCASDLRSIKDDITGFKEDVTYVSAVRATENKTGVWDLMPASGNALSLDFSDAAFASVRRAIHNAKRRHDILVFYLHYQPNIAGFTPRPEYVSLGQRILDAGADIFVGNHPHHEQGFSIHRGKVLITSAGEMMRSYADPYFTNQGIDLQHSSIVKIRWENGRAANIKFLLTTVNNQNCTVSIEHSDVIDSARKRIKGYNPDHFPLGAPVVQDPVLIHSRKHAVSRTCFLYGSCLWICLSARAVPQRGC